MLVIDRGQPGKTDFAAEMAAQSTVFEPVMRKGDDPFITIYTSGTTGNAKGVAVPFNPRQIRTKHYELVSPR